MAESCHVVKSSFDSHVTFASRTSSVCTHTFLHPTSPIYIVPDLRSDINHKDSPFIAQYPYMRFFAGASIFVDDIKVGVLVALGLSPNNDFDNRQQTILIELAECIGDLLRVRRSESRQKVVDRIHVHQSTLRSIKPALNDAIDNKSKIGHLLRVIRECQSNLLSSNSYVLVSMIDLENAYIEIRHQVLQFERKVNYLSNLLQQTLCKLQKEILPLSTYLVANVTQESRSILSSELFPHTPAANETLNKKLTSIPFTFHDMPTNGMDGKRSPPRNGT